MQLSKLAASFIVAAGHLASADLMMTYYWPGDASPPAGLSPPFAIDWLYNDGNWHKNVNAGYNRCSGNTGVYTQQYLCLEPDQNWRARFQFQGEGERCMRLSSCGGTNCGHNMPCTACTWYEGSC